MPGLTSVTIDFQTSHLVFPILIGLVLAVLGLCILIRDRLAILGSGAMWAQTWRDMDRVRFIGTVALTVIYFLSMVPVGDIWPNTGYGFLICSVPFVFLLGVLFMHDHSLPKVATVGAVALVAPPAIWWLFSEIFFLTLP